MLYNKAISATASAQKIYIEDVFSTYLYTGNGSTQTITNGIDIAGKGGLVWLKERGDGGTGSDNHSLYDTARTRGSVIYTNLSSAAQSPGPTQGLTAFTNSGFTVGSNYASDNRNTVPIVSWTFRKTAKFFDVVTYTGNGGTQTINHNLGTTPGCIIIKCTSSVLNWNVYHRSLGNSYFLVLNNTNAATGPGATVWGNTDPTSTQFTVGSSLTTNGDTYVAYLFAHDAGGFGDSGNDNVISCGSYDGDGTSNRLINLGWEAEWVLLRPANNSADWFIYDTRRGAAISTGSKRLAANLSDAEADNGSTYVYPDSLGFRVNGSYFANNTPNTYIYIAIRRGPMKTPTDATKVFDADLQAGSSVVTTGFPVDLTINTVPSIDGLSRRAISRLTGGTQALVTNASSAESTYSSYALFDNNTGFTDGGWSSGAASAIFYSFRRAPGFFDVVAYTGTGSVRTVSHNLGVAPELIIVKLRSGSAPWVVYVAPLGNTKNLFLNQNFAQSDNSPFYWNNTSPTSSVFSLGLDADVNLSASTYIAYLFATCPGVSKVGSYTGTGTTLQVNCGFSAGARFVLIKRTDTPGDWYVWDTARGIVSGNDPFLFLNSTAVENTSTDYIDPLSTGFEISSTAPAAINASGGTFIYLAIA